MCSHTGSRLRPRAGPAVLLYSAGRGELLYYMTPLAEQQIKNSMGKCAMFTS